MFLALLVYTMQMCLSCNVSACFHVLGVKDESESVMVHGQMSRENGLVQVQEVRVVDHGFAGDALHRVVEQSFLQ
jgi:hypothetical protein